MCSCRRWATAWTKSRVSTTVSSLNLTFPVASYGECQVQFRRLNLMDGQFPIKNPLDLIFCRNVMIYFDRPTQETLVKKFHRHLKPGGYLFIGHSESLQWVDHAFKSLAPTIYQKEP